MDMPREHSRLTAQGCIERVILRRLFVIAPVPIFVAVVVMGMFMLLELHIVPVRVTVVIKDDRDRKRVGLRNLLDRFPIGSAIRKPEVLTLVVFPT